MGHPLTLLRQVAADLTRAWPPARGYRYEFERPLPGMRSMIPDITVTDARGEVRCVVEIGYTRPEKLTYYRAQGIEDVRWYDKTGTLHSDVDVRTRIVVRQERLTPPKALRFLRIDWVGQASCETCIARELDRCFCAGTTCEACARGDVEQCGCAACVAGDRHDCSCDPDACLCDPRVPPDDAEEARIYDEHRETLVTMISNGVRVIGLLYCDECDESVVINDYFDLTCGTQGAPTICFAGSWRTVPTVSAMSRSRTSVVSRPPTRTVPPSSPG